MTALPPIAPVVGLANRVRLARDYYVRVDTNDYSVDPQVIGRFVDVTASPTRVVVTCDETWSPTTPAAGRTGWSSPTPRTRPPPM